jgi:hypothetical protein
MFPCRGHVDDVAGQLVPELRVCLAARITCPPGRLGGIDFTPNYARPTATNNRIVRRSGCFAAQRAIPSSSAPKIRTASGSLKIRPPSPPGAPPDNYPPRERKDSAVQTATQLVTNQISGRWEARALHMDTGPVPQSRCPRASRSHLCHWPLVWVFGVRHVKRTSLALLFPTNQCSHVSPLPCRAICPRRRCKRRAR